MRLRNLLLVGVLGFTAAALPALASSETTPTVEAVSKGNYEFAWSPTPATAAAGAAVKFSTGSTTAPHGIIWSGGPATPSCTGVPVNRSAPEWSGSCTFTQAGTYTFYCAYHGESMSGKIVVTAAGTTTTTTTTPPPTTTTSPPTPTPTSTTPSPTPKPKPSSPSHSTKAKKLAKALKACKRLPKGKRAACVKRAHKRYGPKKK